MLRFVSFEGSETKLYAINPGKVVDAYAWLKENNHLYHDVQNNTAFSTVTTQNKKTDQTLLVDQLEENAIIPVNYSDPIQDKKGTSNFPSLLIKRSNSDPVCIYEIPFGEEKAFPWLFLSQKIQNSRMKTHNNILLTNQQQTTNSVLVSKLFILCNIHVKVQILTVGLLNLSLSANSSSK